MKGDFQKWYIREKQFLKRGLYIGIYIGLFLGAFTFLFIVSLPLYNQGQNNFIQQTKSESFEKVSVKWQNYNSTRNLANLCILNKDEYYQIRCVLDFLYKNSEVGSGPFLKEHTNILIESPDGFFSDEVVCRDMATMACAVFNNMNMSCQVRVSNDHAWNYINNRWTVDVMNNLLY